MRTVLIASLLAVSATALALPPGAEQRGFRDGANHRAGDDSFVAAFGRAPTSDDDERVRMKTHLQHVRAQLARKPATTPVLAERRAELLGFLDDYIAKGITPVNTRLPWRTPVFIDDRGSICAVGYLIERSVGRALPEKIAATHRYDFLEDIAAAMPEVRDWIASSGLTLDELASIQPGYGEPEVEAWGRASYFAFAAPDGAYDDDIAGGVTNGKLRRGRMEGAWTRTVDEAIVGTGTFARGAGTWTSFYPDGKRMARGPFKNNHPHGRWTLFHPSGNVAAVGNFDGGSRQGTWQFFHDTKSRTRLASGRFMNGSVLDSWRHYDANGRLLAVTRGAGPGEDPTSRGATLMTIVPGKNGAAHEVHATGGLASRQLHMVARGGERLYVDMSGMIFDDSGNRLRRSDDGWTAAPCGWSKKRKAIAANGDVSTLHRLIRDTVGDDKACPDSRAVSKTRAAKITKTLGALAELRAPAPKFIKALALGEMLTMSAAFSYDVLGTEPDGTKDQDDFVRILTASLAWYTEWPHVDGRFIVLFPTLAGAARTDEIYTKTRERNPDFDKT